MRGRAETLSELEGCKCSLYNPVSDLTWESSQWEGGMMEEVEEHSFLGEVGGSGVVCWFFFCSRHPPLQIYAHRDFLARLKLPSLPLRELITIC